MSHRFVTIVPHAEDLELRKDPGQIPYHFYKTLGYDSTLVSYFYTLTGGREKGPATPPPPGSVDIAKQYPSLLRDVPGLKVHFLAYKGRGKFYENAIYDYIIENARKIDVLNLFHFSSENIFYTLLYKLKNPRGKVYLKLDIDVGFYESRKDFFNLKGATGLLKRPFYLLVILPLFFRSVALISAETKKGFGYFKKRFAVSAKKMAIVPNGIDAEKVREHAGKIKSFDEKENIILTVGRIGNVQKNNELLMGALSSIDLKGWKAYFVGPIEHGFEHTIAQYYADNPHLRSCVFFTGAAETPAALYGHYNKSKVFCSTSNWESFGIAIAEAIYFGCYPILSSSIASAPDLTNNESFGHIFDASQPAQLGRALQKIIDREKEISDNYDNIIAYAHKNFTWQNIVGKISI